MNKLMLAVALLSAPLAACTANQALESAPVVGNVCAAADRTLVDEKTVFAAGTLYNISADAFKKLVLAGQFPKSPLRDNVRAKILKMRDLRLAINHARGAVNCDFAQMKALHSDVMSLIPRSN